jgi:lipid-A-disaccharide synthase
MIQPIATQPYSPPDDQAMSQPIRIFISTGEVSGDLQGALLVTALHKQAAALGLTLEILALGGDRMAAAGATLLENTVTTSAMGLVESIPYILPTLKIQKLAKQALLQQTPDLLILIDYMGPNLTLGTFAHNRLPQLPVVYYIAPQEWVWSTSFSNTARIVKMTTLLLAIFPGEADYFRSKGAQVKWVGHPLVDRMQDAPDRTTARQTLNIPDDQIAIALLPASRRQELKYLMPIMFEAARQIQTQLPSVHFWIPLSLAAYRPAIEQSIQHYGLRATVLSGEAKTGDVKTAIAAADLALCKSGTANLEIALLKVPQVVVYRLSPITEWIGKLIRFSIPFASPVNLIVMREIVPEFIQDRATADNIAQAALNLLLNPDRREQTRQDYAEMQQKIGSVGVCDRAAEAILDLVKGFRGGWGKGEG